jgi:DNA-directed RNA polymerase subunit H (RpoH/RPB5)
MEREIYEARLNAGQMLRDRGYSLEPKVSDIPFEEFIDRVNSRSMIDMYAEKPDEQDVGHRRVFVRFLHSLFGSQKRLQQSSVDKEIAFVVNSLTELDKNNEGTEVAIVFVCEKTPHKNLEGLLPSRYPNVEVLLFDQLQINPTRHFLVPPHELLPREEEDAFLTRINRDKSQARRELPRIASTDPIVRWYGFRSGRICKVTRTSEQTGRSIYYRLVA